MDRCPQPIIAAIRGYALGGGLELALACDLRIASEDAQLGLTEINLAIIPGGGGTQRLPRLIGRGKALEMILTGARIDAREALSLGLVERVAPAAGVLASARELARALAEKAPVALRYAKEAVVKGLELPLADGLRLENDLATLLRGLTDAMSLPPVGVEVLAARPHARWGELHGLYTNERGKPPKIQLWMRTAKQKRVVAFRTFLRTLLHEVGHHVDYTGLRLKDSFHTEGFYKRESSLFYQLVPERRAVMVTIEDRLKLRSEEHTSE